MPAGATSSPGTTPSRIFRFGRFPQHKISRVTLIGSDLYAGACQHIVQRAIRKSAVFRHRLHSKEHMTLRFIRVPLANKRLRQLNHCRDVVRGVRLKGGSQRVKLGHVLTKLIGILLGNRIDRSVLLPCGLDDLVLNIGNVAGIHDIFVVRLQHAKERIKDDDRSRITDMSKVIYRRSADIHAHCFGLKWFEEFLLSRQGVVQFQAHEPNAPLPRYREDLLSC